jgi:hypothetical protein
MVFENDQGRREIWPLKSKGSSDFIRWSFYEAEEKGLSGEALSTARGTLAAQARFQGPRRTLHLRVAETQVARWYDLGDRRKAAAHERHLVGQTGLLDWAVSAPTQV